MSPSRKQLKRLERKLDEVLDVGEEEKDPLRGLVELPPQDMGKRSDPLEDVLERRSVEPPEQQTGNGDRPDVERPE